MSRPLPSNTALDIKALAEALAPIHARFQSGNSVPVEKAIVPKHEWDNLVSQVAFVVGHLSLLSDQASEEHEEFEKGSEPPATKDDTADTRAEDIKLRDQIALHMLPTLVNVAVRADGVKAIGPQGEGAESCRIFAGVAYALADAMMEERAK